MAVGRWAKSKQAELWIATDDVAKAPAHPFYQRLNQILAEADFDLFVEGIAAPHYAEKMGRPSMPPSVYVRLLLVGYFEGIGSERGIAWRVADSMSLRSFLHYDLTQQTPDHSTISRTRRLLPKEFHEEVFGLVIQILASADLIRGTTVGVDGSTMDANAALRSIVRRDTGQQYQQFLEELARASGIESPTREDLVRIDKDRKKKTSNEDWKNPHDPDAKVTKTKDGRTHLAHKVENAVDMDTGAILAAEVHAADRGDTQTFPETLDQAIANVEAVIQGSGLASPVEEVVADKGMHSGPVLVDLAAKDVRAVISEPNRGRRKWVDRNGELSDEKALEQRETYANRRRIRGDRGRGLLRRRGEVLERAFAHLLDTGGIRRTTLRGRDNVAKRYLIQAAAFNLSLIMRKLIGAGKPRWAAALLGSLHQLLAALLGITTRVRGAVVELAGAVLASLRDLDLLRGALDIIGRMVAGPASRWPRPTSATGS